MPTLTGTTRRLALNQSSQVPTLEVLSGEKLVLPQGLSALLQCALFDDTPSSDSFVGSLANVVSADLVVRKNGPNGGILFVENVEVGDMDGTTTWATWLAGTKQQIVFEVSEADTTQTVPQSGRLPIYWIVTINRDDGKDYVAGFGYGEIENVGYIANPVPTEYLDGRTQIPGGKLVSDFDLNGHDIVDNTIPGRQEEGVVSLTSGQLSGNVTFQWQKTVAAANLRFEYGYVDSPKTSPQQIAVQLQDVTIDGFHFELSDAPATNLSKFYWKIVAVADGVVITPRPRYVVASRTEFSLANYITGNDVADDSAGMQVAMEDAREVGGVVIIPPGMVIRLATAGFTVPSGVQLEGAGWPYNNGVVPNSPRPGAGSWFHIVDDGFVPITIEDFSSGTGLRKFGMFWDQPTPALSWSPTIYPYAIEMGDVGDIFLEKLMLLNPSHGIRQNSNSGAKVAGRITLNEISGQPLVVGAKMEFIADVNYVNKIHWYSYWSSDANVLTYTQANTVGFLLGRLDNAQFNNIFCYGHNTLFSMVGKFWSGGADGGVHNTHFVNIGADSTVQLAGIGQDDFYGNLFTHIYGGSTQGNALFNLLGTRIELTVTGFRSLGGRFLHVTGDNNVVRISNGLFDVLGGGITDKMIQVDGVGNDVVINSYYSKVARSSFDGGAKISLVGGNLGLKWVAITPLNSWTNAGGSNEDFAYAYNDGWVYLKGFINAGTTTAGTIIGNLPSSDLFPPKPVSFLVISNGVSKSIYIDAAGHIILNVTSGTDLDLSTTIRYRVT